MSDPFSDPGYWENRWQNHQTGWDIGHPSPPITKYFDQVDDKDSSILIPGCGNAWEGEYLVSNGFTNITLLDIAPQAVKIIRSRIDQLVDEQVQLGDFFEQSSSYDYIVEQTFFCALHPDRREEYVRKTHEILNPGGTLIGVLFNRDFGNDHPPFGGDKEEYLGYFEPYFDILHLEPCDNSIAPRAGSELFIELRKR